ncbi:hypothetical protein ARMGADRAFT_1035755 [Armillaria gallica]|uniref:Uncharacterized protein n=1 Tax=Armillaria gallica TaxID=47427 RepID=A0A2H3CWW1_ARMGA|nr:hypothetical protein ARMGADRAFT_1035755 [Armillaria gallica]
MTEIDLHSLQPGDTIDAPGGQAIHSDESDLSIITSDSSGASMGLTVIPSYEDDEYFSEPFFTSEEFDGVHGLGGPPPVIPTGFKEDDPYLKVKNDIKRGPIQTKQGHDMQYLHNVHVVPLHDWFKITQRNFCQVHPHFHWEECVFLPEEIQDMVINNHMQHQELLALSVKIRSAAGGPVYSCPECRGTVKNPLVEVFRIKSVVRTVASAQGENSPQRGSGSRNSQS